MYTKNNRYNTLIINSLRQELEELAELLCQISDDDYTHKKYETQSIIEGSIGEHVRHALDHIFAVLHVIDALKKAQPDSLCISYDRRDRNTPLEKERLLCIEKIRDCTKKLNLIHSEQMIDTESKPELSLSDPENILQKDVEIEHMTNTQGHYAFFVSNIARELMFVCHHLIHHKAIIAIKLRLLDRFSDPKFGVAPATRNQFQNL